jgi:hypothetical protein
MFIDTREDDARISLSWAYYEKVLAIENYVFFLILNSDLGCYSGLISIL